MFVLNYLLVSTLLQITKGYEVFTELPCIEKRLPEIYSENDYLLKNAHKARLSKDFNTVRSKIAIGNIGWLAGKMTPNMQELPWSRFGEMIHVEKEVLECTGSSYVEQHCNNAYSTKFHQEDLYSRDLDNFRNEILNGLMERLLLQSIGRFNSLEELCGAAEAQSIGYEEYLFLACWVFNPFIDSFSCRIETYAKKAELKSHYVACRFCTNPSSVIRFGKQNKLDFLKSQESGVPCSRCGEKRCSQEYFGLCAANVNAVYQPVKLNLTTVVYVTRTYPTLPTKMQRIRRNRHLVRKAVKQRIRWADVYGPDFVINPLFMLYKTIVTRKTTTTPPPYTGLYVPQPAEIPKGEEPQPAEIPKGSVPEKRKPVRKHDFVQKDKHDFAQKKYWQPDYSSGLISLGTEKESEDCLKKFRMSQKCGAAERIHLNYLLAVVCTVFAVLF